MVQERKKQNPKNKIWLPTKNVIAPFWQNPPGVLFQQSSFNLHQSCWPTRRSPPRPSSLGHCHCRVRSHFLLVKDSGFHWHFCCDYEMIDCCFCCDSCFYCAMDCDYRYVTLTGCDDFQLIWHFLLHYHCGILHLNITCKIYLKCLHYGQTLTKLTYIVDFIIF